MEVQMSAAWKGTVCRPESGKHNILPESRSLCELHHTLYGVLSGTVALHVLTAVATQGPMQGERIKLVWCDLQQGLLEGQVLRCFESCRRHHHTSLLSMRQLQTLNCPTNLVRGVGAAQGLQGRWPHGSGTSPSHSASWGSQSVPAPGSGVCAAADQDCR